MSFSVATARPSPSSSSLVSHPTLSLLGPGQHAGDDVALREREDDEDGHDHDQPRQRGFGALNRQVAPAQCRVQRGRIRDQCLQLNRQVVLGIVREHHVRQEEVVPVAHEAEEGDQAQDRLGQRQCDRPEQTYLGGSIDAARCQQFPRQARRELDVGEVDPKGEEGRRQDHRERGVELVDGVDLQEEREDRGRAGHDHGQ